MSSKKKHQSNRVNAKKSTGPKSESGKWRASQNACTSRFFSKSWLLMGESKRELRNLLKRLFDKWRPVDDVEERLVLEIADANWRLRRLDQSLTLRLEHFQRTQACQFGSQITIVNGKKIDIQDELFDSQDRYAEDAVPTKEDLKRAGRRFVDNENLDHDLKANRVRRELVRQMLHAQEKLEAMQERRMQNDLDRNKRNA